MCLHCGVCEGFTCGGLVKGLLSLRMTLESNPPSSIVTCVDITFSVRICATSRMIVYQINYDLFEDLYHCCRFSNVKY